MGAPAVGGGFPGGPGAPGVAVPLFNMDRQVTAGSGSRGLVPPPKIRSKFPETWIWDDTSAQ